MTRFLALSVFLTAAALMAEDELPVDPDEPLEIEPPLLIQEIPSRDPVRSTPQVASEPDPEQIQIALDKAKKSAAAGERLYRSGVIAKVDVENRALKVIRLESDLANAKLELATQIAATEQGRFDAGEISQSELEIAQVRVDRCASDDAASAALRRERAELDAALAESQSSKETSGPGKWQKIRGHPRRGESGRTPAEA